MKINASSHFKRSYKKLPSRIRNDFDERIAVFMKNPSHSSLKAHKLKGKLQKCLAFSLQDGYRVLFEFPDKKTVNLLDVGPHDKYKKWKK